MENSTPGQKFTLKLLSHLNEIFKPESENFIDLNEVLTNNDATVLVHVVANIVPAMFYSRLTGEELDLLDFNHLANKLVFQYSEKE